MPPQNAGYMYVAYVIAIALYALYALSIWWRGRTLMRRAARTASTRGSHDAR